MRYMEEKKIRLMLVFLFLSIFLTQTVNTKNSAPARPQTSKHFVLIHGACHGAWSWYKLVAMLRLLGHNVTALDLAASGINSMQVNSVRFISEYFQPLRDFIASLPQHERVILVAHSFGGLGISQAMERFPEKIAVAVFVTALMPGLDLNVTALNKEAFKRQGPLLDSHYIYDNGTQNPPTGFAFGPKALSEMVYQRSPSEDLALATTLLRPLYLYSEADMAKELKLTTSKYGSVSRVFIISEEDKLQEKDFQHWMIMKNPPDEVEVIKGSDHMVMISKPVELFVRLLSIAEKYS